MTLSAKRTGAQQFLDFQRPVDFRPAFAYRHLPQPDKGSQNMKMLAVPARSYS